MCVFSGEVAGQKATRQVVVYGGWFAHQSGGFSSSSKGVFGVAITSGGVLFVDLCAAAGCDLLSTSPSVLGVVATAGVGSSGWSDDESGCEGAGPVNGREDGAVLQNGREDGAVLQNSGVVVDGRRSLSGSGNAVLILSSSHSDGVHKVDGRQASYAFNRAPLVNFGGTGSQVDEKLVIGKVSRTLFPELDAKASHETIVPLSRSVDSADKNGSSLNWLKNENLEAIRMWSIEQELGFSFNCYQQVKVFSKSRQWKAEGC